MADLALERRDHGGEVARGGRRLPGVVRVVLRVVVVAALPGGGPRLGRGRAAVAAVHGGRDDGAELGLQAGRRALVHHQLVVLRRGHEDVVAGRCARRGCHGRTGPGRRGGPAFRQKPRPHRRLQVGVSA
ncbi:hypothetical protein EG873_15495, partial [Enterococcus faecalis]